MTEFMRAHQLNIMLALGSVCCMLFFFTTILRAASKKRKLIMMLMTLSAAILLYADRFAYIYRGNISALGYYMVRISNFLVFSMTISVIYLFNMYLKDLGVNEAGMPRALKRLKLTDICAAVGILLIVISQFTGFYYTFDETNHYVRSSGFIVCYIIPILMTLIQLSAIIEYYNKLSRRLLFSMLLFVILPIAASITQIFVYGLSLTNIALVGVVLLLYVFALLDMNKAVEQARISEIERLESERRSMKRLFEQTATAFVAAIDAKEETAKGHSIRVANKAEQLARACGKNSNECEEVYYAALLHEVGKLGIPDSILQKSGELSGDELKKLRQKPVIGNEILSNITEYPFISMGAHYCYERFDGTGYPAGLSGEDIPEIARIIAVADAYDSMTNERKGRAPMPANIVREEFIKGAGEQFDPVYAAAMVQMIDDDTAMHTIRNSTDDTPIERELNCGDYRSTVSTGIPITGDEIRITFNCRTKNDAPEMFSAPAVILFDSYDTRVHSHKRTIDAYQYTEYGELWFDGHSIATNLRNIDVNVTDTDNNSDDGIYEITAGRYGDHLKLTLTSAARTVEVIAALHSDQLSVFFGLTGENCRISDITVEKTGNTFGQQDIPRITDKITYLDRMESDMPNIQIDQARSAATAGVCVRDGMRLIFHTMSLPMSTLVWQCPYIVLFYSDDKQVGGPGYREYALIKLDGEIGDADASAENKLIMKKTDAFKNWDTWKECNKRGLECEVRFKRKGNKVITITENLGISIKNTTIVNESAAEIYAAITGDECAITDIRIT